MLESIEVRTPSNELLLNLPVTKSNPESNFIIKDVTGLGPVKADLTLSTYVDWDGGVFRTARTGARNIVMTIGFKPDYARDKTIEDLRRELYLHLPPKEEIRLDLIGGWYHEEQMWIMGIVESNEPVIFAKDPTVQISIICPDPHFSAMQDFYVAPENGFSFESAQFGEVETGFRLEVWGNPNVKQFTVSNGIDPSIVYKGATTYDDSIIITTIRGEKDIIRERNGVTYPALNGLLRGGLSMSLGHKKKKITITATDGIPMIFNIRMQPKFVGF